jgi:hypothetical protein
MRTRSRWTVVLFTIAWPTVAAHGQVATPPAESYPSRCGADAGKERGYIPLPRGEVFCPLIADPKAIRSFFSYQRGDAADFAGDIAAVGIGDEFGFFRVAGERPGDGVQMGLTGAVFAQFDLSTSSLDLLNADYLIALPLTFRRSGFSTRLRVYHQSSHLGDEFLLRPEPPERENLSFESADLVLSQDIGAFRGYAGGEYFFRREPNSLPKKLLHGGVELRPRASVGFGTIARARLIAAADVKAVSDSSWRVGVNLRAGFEVGRPREPELPGRRWSLLFEYYEGPSPYGQFHRSDIRLTGLGIHFSL